jgi:hypothetical protein
VTGFDSIPPHVQQLLREHVPSFEALEILLLLHAHPQEEWHVDLLASRFGVDREIAEHALSALRFAGLVSFSAENQAALVRYSPKTAALAEAVLELAGLFEDHRAAIIVLMNANAIERVRYGAIRTFADAFVIRKKDTTDG